MIEQTTDPMEKMRRLIAGRVAIKAKVKRHSKKQMERRLKQWCHLKRPIKIGHRNVKQRRLYGNVIIYRQWKLNWMVNNCLKMKQNCRIGAQTVSPTSLYDKTVHETLTKACRESSLILYPTLKEKE